MLEFCTLLLYAIPAVYILLRFGSEKPYFIFIFLQLRASDVSSLRDLLLAEPRLPVSQRSLVGGVSNTNQRALLDGVSSVERRPSLIPSSTGDQTLVSIREEKALEYGGRDIDTKQVVIRSLCVSVYHHHTPSMSVC